MTSWLLVLSVLVVPGEPAVPEPIGDYHSNTLLAPACADKQLSTLKQSVEAAADHREPATVWRLVERSLCGNGESTSQLLKQHMPELLATEEYGVREDPGPFFNLTPREIVLHGGGHYAGVILPLKKMAWGAEVQARGGDIVVNYQSAGVCSDQIRIRFVSNVWLIVGVGIGCD